ncbi:uncharacterized protein LOC129774303 [Toxorhynchites rutilus septentrionalis]|uniref:uncharacterized protein LOC129774303 n=1 Tax=Toxorhynchites rutilus septentrionalis TaxID=329112 RepID=UPI002479F39D|nr:uncharacterized protein LOC129774303 [Toxorhynchites rutilus septentrionalis]
MAEKYGTYDTLIIRKGNKNPRTTIRAIKERLDLDLSNRTIRRRLVEWYLKIYFAKKRPMISSTNKKQLQFARDYANKPLDFWKCVIRWVEFKFELFNKKRRLRVWRKSDVGLLARYLPPTMKHGDRCIML